MMNQLLADARVEIERCATGQPFNLLPLEAQAVIDEMARLRVFDELLATCEAVYVAMRGRWSNWLFGTPDLLLEDRVYKVIAKAKGEA